MSESSEPLNIGDTNGNSLVDRRNFIKAAGVIGTVGAASLLGAATTVAAEAQTADEFPKPKGLGPKGLLDARFPVTYQKSVPAAVKVVTQFFIALSQRDLKAMAETLHFPFASYEGTDAVVIQTPEELLAHAPASLNMSLEPERFTDHDGYLTPGSYDVWDGIEVFNADPVRVNLSFNYNRYDKTGKKIMRCEGIYCITNNDGKWAIQLMSTIFTPADMVGVVYNDSIEACLRLRQDHCLAFQVNDGDDLTRTRQFGKTASITDGNFTLLQTNAINGNPMATFRAKGVKTRLVVTDISEESLKRHSENPDFSASARAMYAKIGKGIKWGYVSGTPHSTRVLHATVNKAHVYTGVTRFTPGGEEINTTMELDVVTYKKGHWGIAGNPLTFAYVTTHDRVNDL
jgi:hypothetical protein